MTHRHDFHFLGGTLPSGRIVCEVRCVICLAEGHPSEVHRLIVSHDAPTPITSEEFAEKAQRVDAAIAYALWETDIPPAAVEDDKA